MTGDRFEDVLLRQGMDRLNERPSEPESPAATAARRWAAKREVKRPEEPEVTQDLPGLQAEPEPEEEGGEVGKKRTVSEETRQRMREAQQRRHAAKRGEGLLHAPGGPHHAPKAAAPAVRVASGPKRLEVLIRELEQERDELTEQRDGLNQAIEILRRRSA